MVTNLVSINNRIKSLLASKPVILQLLRFAAIGAINTALDFIILNYITKVFGVSEGTELGLLNAISFSAAVVQSYYWNKAWTFQKNTTGNLQNAIRLFLVGGLGVAAFVAVIWGAVSEASPTYYLGVLASFIVLEIIFWRGFGLKADTGASDTTAQFISFVAISVIGLLINSFLLSIVSAGISMRPNLFINPDTIKNIAKAAATIASLAWNFIGYKLIVFKK